MGQERMNHSAVFKVLILTALFIGGLACMNAQEFAGGQGTEEDPWQIATAEHLDNVRNYLGEEHEDKHFIQTANIDLYDATREGGAYWNEGRGWMPIGDYDNTFRGNYNGNELEIRGVYTARWGKDQLGLFGYIFSATISNLGVTNINVNGRDHVGGLVGSAQQSTISNSYSTGSVRGYVVVGGLAGITEATTISNSYSTGSVTGDVYIGGLVGHAEIATISNSYSTSTVGFGAHAGGLVGHAETATISNSYSTGSVRGFAFVGGLVGFPSASISNSYSTGNVTGTQDVGGLVGGALSSATIRNSYYNYEQVLINEENVITIGALDDEMYNTWFDNDLSLEIDDYLDFDVNSYLINSESDFKKLLAFGQFDEYSFQLNTDLNLADHTNPT